MKRNKTLKVCSKCGELKRPINLFEGKCLDCYRIQAVETAGNIRDNWNREVGKIAKSTYRMPKMPFWLRVKLWLFNAGEKVLDKAIDRAADRFSIIIFAILIIVIAGVLMKERK